MIAPDSLAAELDRAGAPWRGLSGLVRIIGGAAIAVASFAAAAWMLRVGAVSGPVGTLAAWGVGVIALVAGVMLARRVMRLLDARHVGEFLERHGHWHRGALTTLLDDPVAGTSRGLHALARQTRAVEVASSASAVLAPTVRLARRSGWRGIAVLVVAGLALAAARPVTGAADAVWHPVTAVRALVAPVQLRARESSVALGARAVLVVDAVGRRRATLYTRAPGESWQSVVIALDASGHAIVQSAPLDAELFAHIEAGGRRSPDVHVAVRVPPFVGGVTATAHYPAYLDLADESLPVTGDTLMLPEGTALTIAGRATTALRSAQLQGLDGRHDLVVDGRDFHGRWEPVRSGSWQLTVRAADGDSLEGGVPALPVRIIADSAPTVDVVIPGADTTATAAPTLGLVIAVRDDHGITAAAIETRRSGSAAIRHMPLALPSDVGDRALLTTTLDLRSLTAGDTLYYRAVATDNAPARHVGRSPEYVVRVPTVAEQQRARAQTTAEAVTGFDSLARRSADVRHAEEDMARERAGDANIMGAHDGGATAPMSNDDARKASAVAGSQQQLLDAADSMRRTVEQLRSAAARNGMADSSIVRQLGAIAQLLDQALTPGMRAQLAQLQQAITSLDPGATQQALQQLAQQQTLLQHAMDQARALFRRAALETSLNTLAETARQLSQEQHAVAAAMAAHADSARSALAEAALARRVDSLASGVEHAAQQVPATATRQGLRNAAQQARAAAEQMRQASSTSAAGQLSQATDAAKQADAQLAPVSQQIAENGQSMQAEMRAEAMQVIARAMEETARLGARQLAVANAMRLGVALSQARTDQGVVDEGAAKLIEQVDSAASLNALLSPRAGIALAQARQFMLDAVHAISPANPDLRPAYARASDAVDALDVAAFSLLQSRRRINGSQSGSGVAEALAQMQQMAAQQGQLAQQGATSLQQGFGSAQQLMQMALRERALALQLDRLRAGGTMPGAGKLAQEAHDLSRDLESGQLNPDVVERQHQLFAHMLDAGRTLQGQQDDESRERHATTAKDAPPDIPPALDARIRYGTGEVRMPSWAELQRLQPDERRRVVDYFQRLTQAQVNP